MKLLISLFVVAMTSGCALGRPLNVKCTVRVLDAETGQPITNAVVQNYFTEQYDPWGNKGNVVKRQEIPVDENGVATVEGKDLYGGAGGTAFADGYYTDGAGKKSERKNLVLNRWEPWNPVIEVKMRPKKNLVPMVCKRVEWKFKIPKYNIPVGLDLEQGDWVQPYGGGIISDLLIEIIPLDPAEKGSQCRITFPNLLDGIQEHEFQWPSSSYKWPYLAPTNGYENILDKYYVLNFPKVAGAPKHNLNKDVNYLIRTRTQVDEDGNITSACYGYFQGEISFIPKGEFKFGYWFNPVPNERSLEYSGENLLKKKK